MYVVIYVRMHVCMGISMYAYMYTPLCYHMDLGPKSVGSLGSQAHDKIPNRGRMG